MNRVFARRFVLVLVGGVFISLISLSGCGIVPTDSPDAMATYASGTLTALAVTPSATATSAPWGKPLVDAINQALENDKVVDDLTKAIDAHYQVMDIRFQPPDGAVAFVDIDMQCVCIHEKCCSPEHTFVILARAMKLLGKKFAGGIPDTTVELHINFRNNYRDTGQVSVLWSELKRYIIDGENSIDAYQLGNNVRITYTP